jgi:hypothetical protein
MKTGSKAANRRIMKTFTKMTALVLALSAMPSSPVSAAEEAQTQGQATVMIETNAPSKPYDPMIFGGFLEHFDNQIYGGVFEPSSSLPS